MSKQQVLVTGATGFLGTHLVKDLVDKGYDVSILARGSSDLSYLKTLPVHVHHGDITDRLALLQATENKDIVFHLAGLIAYKRKDRKLMDEVNVKGTANVIDACLTNNCRLLHLSSVVTIGANRKPAPIDEDFKYNLKPFNLGYFETKRQAEDLVMQSVANDQLKAFVINPSTIYGAGDATKGSRKTQIKVAKGQFKLFPPGGVNVVYVDDVIQAIHLCISKGQIGRRYIISGDNMTIKELFTIIADAAGVPPPSIPIPRFGLKLLGSLGDLSRNFGLETSLSSETAITSSLYHWFSNDRAKKELGFKPTPAKVAIKESVTWMKENGLLKES